jgi:hypothetical protein
MPEKLTMPSMNDRETNSINKFQSPAKARSSVFVPG